MPAIEVFYNIQLKPEDYPVAVLRTPFAPAQEWQIWQRPQEFNNQILSHEKCYVVKLPKQPGLPID